LNISKVGIIQTHHPSLLILFHPPSIPYQPMANPSSSSLNTRKRPAASQAPVDEDQDQVLALGADFGEEDGELDQDEEYEIDVGSSNGDIEDFEESEDEEEVPIDVGGRRLSNKTNTRSLDDKENQDDFDSSDGEFDDEDDGFDNSSGYNSSEIDALSSPPSPTTPSTSLPSSSTSFPPPNATLDELIAFHSHKPTDQDSLTQYQRESTNGVRGSTFSSAKQGNGKLVKSKLVKGGWKREYEDIEAGYGSESSTEDVSLLNLLHLHLLNIEFLNN
jgi:ribosome biogenesis protein ERB1